MYEQTFTNAKNDNWRNVMQEFPKVFFWRWSGQSNCLHIVTDMVHLYKGLSIKFVKIKVDRGQLLSTIIVISNLHLWYL